jgi:DNA-directed RNA polymerase specialized sigma subunit
MPDYDFLEPEYQPIWESWKKDPNPANSGTLLKAVNPVINAALRAYAGVNPSPTIRSRAKLLTLHATGSYDPNRAKLRTHLMTQLQGLRRHVARESMAVSVPEQVALDLGHVREAENRLRDQLGRDPSTGEMTDYTGLSHKRLGYLQQHRYTRSEGSMQRPTEEGEDIYAPAVEAGSDHSAWHEFVYNDLDPVDQVILEHALGLHGKPVLQNQQIAKKLRLSPGAVSQRKAKIQAKLNLQDDLHVF